ncbi:hypothetical protein C7U61_00005, partial [Rhizobium sp. JAB6]
MALAIGQDRRYAEGLTARGSGRSSLPIRKRQVGDQIRKRASPVLPPTEPAIFLLRLRVVERESAFVTAEAGGGARIT